MAVSDYLVLIYSPDCTTILIDPIGPASYEVQRSADGPVPFYRSNVPGWRSINLGPRYNEAGSGTIVVNTTLELFQAVTTPEVRIAVIREPLGQPAVIEMAGPLENASADRDAATDGTDGLGTITIQFTDDLASLATRLVYPNPAQPAAGQSVTKRSYAGVNAEEAARDLVQRDAGPGALTGRRFPEIALGVDNNVGASVTTSFTRAIVLTDALRSLLLLGGGLGMRTTQVGEQALFEVYQPRDLSASVWFAWDLGNIRTLNFEFAAPTATVAIVGDEEAGVARIVRERTNADALAAGWRRKEIFVDARSAANITEVEQLGDEALADTGPTVRVNIQAIETAQQRYRRDFGIGDTVSVEIFDGFVITDIIRGVDITVSPDRGEVITPLIGAAGDQEIDLKAQEIERLKKRLAQLEGAL